MDGQVREPGPDASRLGLRAALATHSVGLVTAPPPPFFSFFSFHAVEL